VPKYLGKSATTELGIDTLQSPVRVKNTNLLRRSGSARLTESFHDVGVSANRETNFRSSSLLSGFWRRQGHWTIQLAGRQRLVSISVSAKQLEQPESRHPLQECAILNVDG
jgi:hypothetical protein